VLPLQVLLNSLPNDGCQTDILAFGDAFEGLFVLLLDQDDQARIFHCLRVSDGHVHVNAAAGAGVKQPGVRRVHTTSLTYRDPSDTLMCVEEAHNA